MKSGKRIPNGVVPGTVPASRPSSTPVPAQEIDLGNGDDPLASIELTPEQQKSWEATMTHMMWVAPGFRHLFFKLLANNHKGGCAPYVAVFTRAVPRAATDGLNILLNPDWFFEQRIPQRTFALCHEVIHNMYNDLPLMKACIDTGTVPLNGGGSLPFNDNAYQHALDYRINPLCVDGKYGKPPEDIVYDPAISAHGEESMLDIYKKIYEDEKGGGGRGGFDVLLPGGKSAGKNAKKTSPSQWAVEVAVAKTLEERHKGTLPAGIKRMFEDILNPEVPWQDHLRTAVNRIAGNGGRDWRKPDRRFIGRDIYLPSRTGYGAGWIVVWGDTSGSIGQKELCSYMAELGAILADTKPKRLTILWCDAKIHFADELTSVADLSAIQHRGVGGGGGTSVAPCFKWIRQNSYEEPDMFIGFTDCCVDFPTEPNFPVIWASVEKKAQVPYGELIPINQRAK